MMVRRHVSGWRQAIATHMRLHAKWVRRNMLETPIPQRGSILVTKTENKQKKGAMMGQGHKFCLGQNHGTHRGLKEILIMGWAFLFIPHLRTQHTMALAHKLKRVIPQLHGRFTHEIEGT